MALKGTPSVLRLSRIDIWLMCSGAVLWVALSIGRLWLDLAVGNVLILFAAMAVLATAVLAQIECRVTLRAAVQKTAAALTFIAVGYGWLWEQQLVWEGLALPVVLTLLVSWYLVLLMIALLGITLLVSMTLLPPMTPVWPYLGSFIAACWLALLLAWRQRQLDDSHIEGRSGDGESQLYNLKRMEVELAREISRADRGNTGLVVLCFRLPEPDCDVLDIPRLAAALKSVMPRHYSAYRVNHKMVAVIMPIATVDDVVLLNADISDALGLPEMDLAGLPLVYAPQAVQREDLEAAEKRIEDMMTVVRSLAE